MTGYIFAYYTVMNIIISTLRLHVHKCLKNTEDTHNTESITWYLARKCADASYDPDKGHISDEH